jgi:hypothetical protein
MINCAHPSHFDAVLDPETADLLLGVCCKRSFDRISVDGQLSTNDTALFIYTDSRNGVGCPAVDAYQRGLDGTGASVAKPAPGIDCPAQFGNSDAYVSKITP